MEFEKFNYVEYILESRSHTKQVKSHVILFLEHAIKYAEIRPQLSGWVASIYNAYKYIKVDDHKNPQNRKVIYNFSDELWKECIETAVKEARSKNNNKNFNINLITKYFNCIDDIMNNTIAFLNEYNNSPDNETRRIVQIWIDSKNWNI